VTPGRVSSHVVATRLAVIREMLAGVSTLPLLSQAVFLADGRMVAAGESFLRRAIEALLDLGRHLLAKGLGEVVPEYAALGRALAAHGIVTPETAERLRQMGGYRNRLVHGDEEVTGAELHTTLTTGLAEIAGAADEVRAWLSAHSDLLDTAL
jgi:uncharacterized protein YutE (UPF0331/DUF86 family)